MAAAEHRNNPKPEAAVHVIAAEHRDIPKQKAAVHKDAAEHRDIPKPKAAIQYEQIESDPVLELNLLDKIIVWLLVASKKISNVFSSEKATIVKDHLIERCRSMSAGDKAELLLVALLFVIGLITLICAFTAGLFGI